VHSLVLGHLFLLSIETYYGCNLNLGE